MGRRAKNKQPAPEPLDAKVWQPGKRTSKRKADGDADSKVTEAGRLVKKARKSESGTTAERLEAKVKVKKQKLVVAGGKGKPKKNADASDDKSSADGWEDLEDGIDLSTHRKYVHVLISCCFQW